MTEERYDKLKALVEIEINAEGAYQQALDTIRDPNLHGQLKKFRDDHQRHIDALSVYLIKKGVEAPKQPPDFKGFMVGEFVSLRNITDVDEALKAMRHNEQFLNDTYAEAAGWHVEPEAGTIIAQHYDDEKGHLAFMNAQVTSRIA